MDKSGANYAGLENINMLLMLAGLISFIEICRHPSFLGLHFFSITSSIMQKKDTFTCINES
jgi:uncharacterized membrane protein